MELQAVPNSIGFLFAKELDQRMVMMRVQVIHHDIDAFCLGMDDIDQVAHGMCKISLRTTVGHQHLARTCFGLNQ